MPQLPTSDRDRARLTRFTFLLHLRPVSLPARALAWRRTFGLGGSSLVLLVLLALTGPLQMLVYQPTPGAAHQSVLTMEQDVLFGPLVRGVHYWSANLLILVVLLHMARVFLTGGYAGRRRFTWVLGAGLLLLILASSFSGYLLPWDQLSYWAVTIATGMLTYVPFIGGRLQEGVLGGAEISAATLVNFYTLHTALAPLGLLVLAAWHFWRVRRAGGVVVPDGTAAAGESDKVLFWPHLFAREVAQGLVLVALILILATLFGAPLGAAANPGMSPNPAKAPWYFLGFQELLIHFHPVFAVLVFPLLIALGLVLLPYLVPDGLPEGRWFLSAGGRRSAILAATLALVATPLLVILDESAGAETGNWLVGGVVPLVVLTAICTALALWTMRRPEAAAPEAIQAVVVLLFVAFIVLTVIGIWFRGEGMALVWPWTGGV